MEEDVSTTAATDLRGPATEPVTAEPVTGELLVDELLVEEISIDGMCGVY